MKKLWLAVVLITFCLINQTAYAEEDSFLTTLASHPVVEQAVEKHVNTFTDALKKPFARWLSRSSKYIDVMKQILGEYNIPQDLVFLSMIESGFSPYAYSPAKAVGPWQFIASTGKRYGLKIDKWVDERRDPIKSTKAAAMYLRDLYKMFGSWGLAMSAYNAGEGAVKRALDRINGSDYYDLYNTRRIADETKNYVPKFIAASLIAADPESHGFDNIEYEKNLSYDEAVLWEPIDLDVAAKCAGTSLKTIRELNPELTMWCTPPNVKSYILKIPKDTLMTFLENLSKLSPEERKAPVRVYAARRGENAEKIARRFGVPVSVVAELNGIRSVRSRIRPGARITLPPQGKYEGDFLFARR